LFGKPKGEAENRRIENRAAEEILGLGVAGEMNFHALGQQPFTAALTASSQGGASAFRLHAGAKTVLPFAGTF